jgi:hypothetical protein
MGTILMENSVTVNTLHERAAKLKKNIRNKFWFSKGGIYNTTTSSTSTTTTSININSTSTTSSFVDVEDKKNGILLLEQQKQKQKQMLLGQSLVMLSDNFEVNHRIKSILKNTNTNTTNTNTNTNTNILTNTTNKLVVVPLLFVSSYFAIAAANNDRDDIFYKELYKQIDDLLLVEEEEEEEEEQSNNNALLNSSSATAATATAAAIADTSGFLGMIYQGMFGMKFNTNPNYILFKPIGVVTKYSREQGSDCDETISLLNFKYRKAIIDIYITGYGNKIESFKINDQVQQQKGEDDSYYKLDSYVTGRQVIEIVLTI